MQRLEEKNYNTKEYYNTALTNHYNETGLDFDDSWRLKELLSNFKGGKILDVGCGVSPLLQMAISQEQGVTAYGMDFADEFIQRIKGRYLNVNYSVGDFNSLPFEDNFFNYVVLGEVIEHAEEPNKLIDEAFRVLKSGGRLALSTPFNEKAETHRYPQHMWSFGIQDITELIGKERIKSLNVVQNNIICHAKND